jgi:hypothetical protein
MEANQILKTFKQVKAGDKVYRMFVNISVPDFHPEVEEYTAEEHITQYPATGLKFYIHFRGNDGEVPVTGVMTGYPDEAYSIDKHDGGCYFIAAPSIDGIEEGWDEIWRNCTDMNMNIHAAIGYARERHRFSGSGSIGLVPDVKRGI